jgi:hypothetical protein
MQKYIIFPKNNPLKETKILQDVITLELISTFNTSQNISSFSFYNKPINVLAIEITKFGGLDFL